MAQNIQERDGRFQLRIKHKLLDCPYFFTFDTEAEAEAEEYRDTLKSYLKHGIQPDAPATLDPLAMEVVRSYEKLGPVTPFDAEMLSATMGDFLGVRVSSITAEWVDAFVKYPKMVANNSPGTIRKKVGSTAASSTNTPPHHRARCAEACQRLPASAERLQHLHPRRGQTH